MAITPLTVFSGNIPNVAQGKDTYAINLALTHQFYDNTMVSNLNVTIPELDAELQNLQTFHKFTNYKGDYVAGTTYSTGESVTYNGYEYNSLVSLNIGNTPDSSPTKWKKAIASVPTEATNITEATYGEMQTAIDTIATEGGKKSFIASGAITAGQVVAINTNSTVSTVTGSNIDDWIGIATQSATDAQTLTVTILKGINENQTGLTINSIYYVDTDATITTIDTGRPIGRAISTTKLQIKGNA